MEINELLNLDQETQSEIEWSSRVIDGYRYPEGKLLKELREDKGITQAKMSELLQKSQSVISRKEKEPDRDFIDEYLYALGIRLADFELIGTVLTALDLTSLKSLKRYSIGEVVKLLTGQRKKGEHEEAEKKRLRSEIDTNLEKMDLLGLFNVLSYTKMYLVYEEHNEVSIEE